MYKHCLTQDHRDNVFVECKKELLCDVVSADGVLEAQIELVARVDLTGAGRIARPTFYWLATGAKNVHLE